MSTIGVEQALRASAHVVADLLLSETEDQWFDRKSTRIAPRELADALIGFGNADGGTVVIGLWNGTIEGTDRSPERRNDQMQAAIDHTVPPVRARSRTVACRRDDGTDDHLLVIEIDPGESVHANRKDVAFLRVGDETRKLSFAQRQELVFDKGQGSYESRRAGRRMEDLDRELVAEYVAALGARSAEGMLHARGLARDGVLTIAGSLLFDRRPQLVLAEAYVRVLRYRGRERGTGSRQQLLADHRVEGPLPAQILRAKDLIGALQPTRKALADHGRFTDVGLVPEDAWLEAVVNAVVHRSYSLAGDHIRVEIFDDRIEVMSPGRFPGIVALSAPAEAPRYARNPRIARVLVELNFGQELGEGIKRMYEEMRLAGLQEPLYRQAASSVHVELSGEPADRRLDALLPEETRAIVGALREAGRLSTMEVANAIGRSRPVAIKRLASLRDADVVVWVGNSTNDPRAYWTLPPA